MMEQAFPMIIIAAVLLKELMMLTELIQSLPITVLVRQSIILTLPAK